MFTAPHCTVLNYVSFIAFKKLFLFIEKRQKTEVKTKVKSDHLLNLTCRVVLKMRFISCVKILFRIENELELNVKYIWQIYFSRKLISFFH